jgi:UDP-N-acetylmuramate--alanine ligase
MKIKSIHFVGIKGVGMTPLAIIAKEAGFHVTGSDIADSFITDDALKKAHIPFFLEFNPSHIKNVDMVIATGAHGGLRNSEVKKAKENHIPVFMQGQAVGKFMDGRIFERKQEGIAISGCHGKTTTTALVATLLSKAEYDPSYIIGTGAIPSLGSSGHFGSGNYFIAEADEYATEPTYDMTPKFLWLYPKILIITNIEFDHPDIYKSIDTVRKAYEKLTKNIKKDGLLIINGDDDNCKKIIKTFKGRKKTFGFNPYNDYVLSRISIQTNKTSFFLDGKNFSERIEIPLIGSHNAMNTTAAIIAGLEIGLSIETMKHGVMSFQGTKRRLEYIGKLPSGALLYDDYAHHPTEIRKTLEGLHALYPEKKIICIFQPHTYSRTKILFEDFLSSFIHADTVILEEIYSSLREKKDNTISSRQLVKELKKMKKKAIFLPEAKNVVKYIMEKKIGPEYIVITMGAGDVYKIHSIWKNLS